MANGLRALVSATAVCGLIGCGNLLDVDRYHVVESHADGGSLADAPFDASQESNVQGQPCAGGYCATNAFCCALQGQQEFCSQVPCTTDDAPAPTGMMCGQTQCQSLQWCCAECGGMPGPQCLKECDADCKFGMQCLDDTDCKDVTTSKSQCCFLENDQRGMCVDDCVGMGGRLVCRYDTPCPNGLCEQGTIGIELGEKIGLCPAESPDASPPLFACGAHSCEATNWCCIPTDPTSAECAVACTDADKGKFQCLSDAWCEHSDKQSCCGYPQESRTACEAQCATPGQHVCAEGTICPGGDCIIGGVFEEFGIKIGLCP